MTIIVIVRKNGQACIAADSMQADGTLTLQADWCCNHNKLLQCGDTYLGLAGWAISQDMLESLIRNYQEKLSFADRESIFSTSLFIHKKLKDKYFLETQEDKEQPVESSQMNALIMNAGGIYELASYRSVTEYEKFWALGSGRSLAIGAMHAVYHQFETVEEIAKVGIEAACAFDDSCALPMNIQSVALKA